MRKNKLSHIKAMIVSLVIVIAVMLTFTGCSVADAANFTVDLHTKISVSGEFYGERVMTVSFDKALALNAFESLDELDALVKSQMPDVLESKLIDDEVGTRYELTVRFKSLDDYISKIEKLLGRKPNIVFETSDRIFMKGLTFQEDFESKELFSFIDVNAVLDSFVSGADVSLSDIPVAAAFIKQSGVVVNVGDKAYQLEGGKVDVAEGKATMISKVSFKTVLKSNGYFERTIDFRMIPEIDQDSYTDIIAYFESVKPLGAEVNATALSSSAVISVEFKARDVSDLSAKTTQVLGDTCTAAFGDVTDASVPFATLEEFTESISFTKLCVDSQMPFTYNIVSERGSPSKLAVEIDGVEADSQPTLGGNTLDYGSQAAYATLKTRYQSISTASLVYYNLIARGDDKFTREIYIIMDDNTSTDILNNIKAYYDIKGAANTHINVLLDGFSEEFTSPCVEIVIDGTAKDITRAEDTLFGGSTERKITYGRAKSIIKVSPDTELCDTYDISSLLSMTNVTSYYYSFISDDELRNGKVDTLTGSYSVKSQENEDCLGFMMSEGMAAVTFTGGYTNVDAIIFIILLILLILLILVLAAVLLLKYFKTKDREKEGVEKREYFPVVIEEEPEPEVEPEPEPEVEEPPVIVLPPVRDLTKVIEPDEEPVDIQVESYPSTTPEINIDELYASKLESAAEKDDSAVKVTVKPIIPVYAQVDTEEPEEIVPSEEAVPVIEKPEERFDENNRVQEVPFTESPYQEEYAKEFAEAETEEYSDADMLKDFEALGLLDEYIERVHKVKIKVKKYKKEN